MEDMLDDNQKHLKYNERIGKIYNTSKKISFNNLTYILKAQIMPQ